MLDTIKGPFEFLCHELQVRSGNRLCFSPTTFCWQRVGSLGGGFAKQVYQRMRAVELRIQAKKACEDRSGDGSPGAGEGRRQGRRSDRAGGRGVQQASPEAGSWMYRLSICILKLSRVKQEWCWESDLTQGAKSARNEKDS